MYVNRAHTANALRAPRVEARALAPHGLLAQEVRYVREELLPLDERLALAGGKRVERRVRDAFVLVVHEVRVVDRRAHHLLGPERVQREHVGAGREQQVDERDAAVECAPRLELDAARLTQRAPDAVRQRQVRVRAAPQQLRHGLRACVPVESIQVQHYYSCERIRIRIYSIYNALD